jgi:glutamine synthetase
LRGHAQPTADKPIVTKLSGGRLMTAETDGSSFPNGGLRQTHRAAAYMSWDRSSPPFVRGDTVYIPSSFVTWNGDALDERTPLLRSQRAVKQAGKKLLPHLHALKKESEAGVICNVGWEQEFFLINVEDFERRPDLVAAGRTVLGALPARNQQTSVNYFASMHERAKRIMEEAQEELLELGVPLSVYHNEVAPAQHEFSPIFQRVNVAMDHNILAMEILKDKAKEHGMVALCHEKPFKGVNGSGKHLNWGLNAGESGRNLFVAGDSAPEQESFMAMVAVLTRAINLHGDLVRAGVASPGNDHRLGAHEAPPAIISLYLGEGMMAHIEQIVAGGPLAGYGKSHKTISFGAPEVAPIEAATEDRNRTAPFPFCGNRFGGFDGARAGCVGGGGRGLTLVQSCARWARTATSPCR